MSEGKKIKRKKKYVFVLVYGESDDCCALDHIFTSEKNAKALINSFPEYYIGSQGMKIKKVEIK